MLKIDRDRARVLYNDKEVYVTIIEYRILILLLKAGSGTVSDDMIMDEVWGKGYLKEKSTLRVYIYRLRAKLKAASGGSVSIINYERKGYALEQSVK